MRSRRTRRSAEGTDSTGVRFTPSEEIHDGRRLGFKPEEALVQSARDSRESADDSGQPEASRSQPAEDPRESEADSRQTPLTPRRQRTPAVARTSTVDEAAAIAS